MRLSPAIRARLLLCLILLATFSVVVGCSTVQQHPITNQDILRVPEGSRIVFPKPVKVGFGPALDEVTTDRVTYLLSEKYLEEVARVQIEEN